jgi:hypothetical protein
MTEQEVKMAGCDWGSCGVAECVQTQAVDGRQCRRRGLIRDSGETNRVVVSRQLF